MGYPIEIFGVDRMMDIVKNPHFPRPSKIVLIHIYISRPSVKQGCL